MTFETSELYRSLRGRLFLTDPKTLGILPEPDQKFWGVMVDIGVESGVATLVVLRDGSISLYMSTGGGMIGLGQHDTLHQKADKIFELAEDFTLEGPDAERDTLPSEGSTRFNFLGYHGARSVEETEETLEEGHPLSPLHTAVHDLIEAAESVDGKRLN